MDRIYVMELVRSFQCGEMSRRQFLKQATLAVGSLAAANLLLAACSPAPAETPPPVVVERTAAPTLAPTTGPAATAAATATAGPTAAPTATTAPSAASAQEPTLPGTGEGELVTGRVEYPDPAGETLSGYLARPQAGTPLPVVIVIQEWWGLNEHIEDVTRRFAREGMVALAPDLYHGAVVSEPNEARKLVMELDMAEAVREIQYAIDFVLGQEYAAGPEAGVVGFCMGGRLALETARAAENLGAAVAFYGSPLSAQEAQAVKAPILGLYGSRDSGISLRSIEAMEAALDQAGIENEMHVYEGAEHAFLNDTRASYHPEAAADAWARAVAWLRKYLA